VKKLIFLFISLMLVLFLFSCKTGSTNNQGGNQGDPGNSSDPPCTPNVPAGVDPAAGASFDSNYMLCLFIEMAGSDFSAMASQTRFEDSANWAQEEFFQDCHIEAPNPFTWFSADITVDGVLLSQAGIRKKGFIGSVIGDGLIKPSIKIKTDRYVDGQFLGGTERITLNNGVNDPTRIRTCLAYDLFKAAGYPAALCNMAHVVVNNQSKGAFIHVEAIKKRFLLRAFGDNSGSLYEGTLADFTEEYISGFSDQTLGHWEAKTDETDPLGLPLRRVYEALRVPDDELLNSLDAVLNVDLFITFWAMEALINHSDGYGGLRNNFYVYFNPTDNNRAVFIPWGADNVFTDTYYVGGGTAPGLDIYLFGELPRRFSRIPQLAARFEAELTRLINEVWNEGDILAAIDRYSGQVLTAENPSGYDTDIQELRTWVQGRKQRIEELLSQGLPLGQAETSSCTALPIIDNNP
jgi:spore coat protein CotH